jgi:CTP synthase
LSDSYISVIEAIKHAAWALKIQPIIEWIDSSQFEGKNFTPSKIKSVLGELDGIIIPGGFGSRGIEGKIKVIKYCRENKVPFFGLCYGMQLAVIEFARNVAKMKKANTREIEWNGKQLVIDVMDSQRKNLMDKNYGGTMRLGACPCLLKSKTIARDAYGSKKISERHRHRYEFNNEFRGQLASKGLVIAGTSPDSSLVEIIELPQGKHPFFVGVQFHPEFKSRPLVPHPLFKAFIKAVLTK